MSKDLSSTQMFIPTDENIHAAEDRRTKGDYLAGYVLVQGVMYFNLSLMAGFSDQEKRRVLTAMRICFGCAFSYSKRLLNPVKMLLYLNFARDILLRYQHIDVVRAASNCHLSITGESYDFSGEMARDTARYLGFISDLRGFGKFALATRLMDLGEQATEPTLKALMLFESYRVNYLYSNSGRNLELLESAAKESIAASMKAQNFERAATVAARLYVVNPHGFYANYAQQKFEEARAHDSTVSTIWEREVLNSGNWKLKLLSSTRRTFFKLWRVDWSKFEIAL